MSCIELTKKVLPYLLPFASAFCGAYAAFRLGRRKQKIDDINKQYSALIETQHVLIFQYISVDLFKRTHLDPIREAPNRHRLLANFILQKPRLQIPFRDIAFLSYSKDPELLLSINFAEIAFETYSADLQHFNKTRQIVTDACEPKNFDLDEGTGELHIPPHLEYLLKDAVNLLYDAADDALPVLDLQILKIYDFIKTTFKGREGLVLSSAKSFASKMST